MLILQVRLSRIMHLIRSVLPLHFSSIGCRVRAYLGLQSDHSFFKWNFSVSISNYFPFYYSLSCQMFEFIYLFDFHLILTLCAHVPSRCDSRSSYHFCFLL